MHSVFDPAVRQELIRRIRSLSPDRKALWGKMTVNQMFRHCSHCEDYYFGQITLKRSFLGRLIGPSAIRSLLKEESSMLRKNAVTPAPFKVTEALNDFDLEKNRWIERIQRYESFDQDDFMHWFFGRMTKDQLGQFIYKHSDHHLRQFGA